MDFKDRVKAVRKYFGLTQKAFAERIGVTRNTIAKYEYEGKNPEGPVIALLCREFGISKDWLLEGKGEMLLPTDERIIAEAAERYGLDDLDRAILTMYLQLDADGRAKLRRAAVQIADAVTETPGLFDLLNRPTAETPEEREARILREAQEEADEFLRLRVEEKRETEATANSPDGTGPSSTNAGTEETSLAANDTA